MKPAKFKQRYCEGTKLFPYSAAQIGDQIRDQIGLLQVDKAYCSAISVGHSAVPSVANSANENPIQSHYV